MSSGKANRLLVVAISSMFALGVGCSGDKKEAGEDMEMSGDEAAVAPSDGEMPMESEAPAPTAAKKGKKKKAAHGKKAKKGKKPKKTGA